MVLDVGMLVYAEGELRNRVIEGDDGKRQYRSEIKLNDMYVLDSKGKKGVGVDAAKSTEGHDNDVPATEEVAPEAAPADTDEFKSEDLF